MSSVSGYGWAVVVVQQYMFGHKDPFRRFPREQVARLISDLDAPAELMSGPKRREDAPRHPFFQDMATFDDLADPVAYFAEAMTIELEHGSVGAPVGTDVTKDDPLATAKIALAHISGVEYGGEPPFTPFPSYYDSLILMERIHETYSKLRQAQKSQSLLF